MKKSGLSLLLIALICGIWACVDRDFDTPPLSGEDPDIDASEIISIRDLLDIYDPGNFVEINRDKYLKVLVVADDRSGNFFRSLVIQDSTGGITILLDDVELWNKYFVGKRLYIDLSDLWISDYNGLPQIGYAPFDDGDNLSLGRIPAVLLNEIIIGGSYNHNITAELHTIPELSGEDLNTLVTLENIQFAESSLNESYADAQNLQAVNHVLEDCDGNTIILRTSGFADFAGMEVPSGKGSITAVYSIFGNDKQLLLRSTDDIDFDDIRCGGILVGDSLFIDFENQQDFEPISLPGWRNVALEGDRLWARRSFGNNGFAEIEAYQDPAPLTDSWLVTPLIITSQTPELSFQSAMAFYKHDGATVYVSTDFTGSVGAATWEELPVRLATETDGDFNWVDSGVVDLSQYGDELHVAFRYVGTAAQNTTKFRVDNIRIE